MVACTSADGCNRLPWFGHTAETMNDDHRTQGRTATNPLPNKALNTAYRILARRDHTRHELAIKLREKGFGRTAIANALARCQALGYLDDAKTARVIASHLVGRGYGPLRVRQTLMQKGLDEHLVETALDCCGDESAQVDSARHMLEKKTTRLARESDPWKRRQKAYRFLVGRGFTGSVINRAIAHI
jgi:regulatory protein